jgi:hypothetical protein
MSHSLPIRLAVISVACLWKTFKATGERRHVSLHYFLSHSISVHRSSGSFQQCGSHWRKGEASRRSSIRLPWECREALNPGQSRQRLKGYETQRVGGSSNCRGINGNVLRRPGQRIGANTKHIRLTASLFSSPLSTTVFPRIKLAD